MNYKAAGGIALRHHEDGGAVAPADAQVFLGDGGTDNRAGCSGATHAGTGARSADAGITDTP